MAPLKRRMSARLARSRLPAYFSLVVLLVVAMLSLPIYWIYAEKLKNQISYINDSLIDQVQSTFDGLLQEIDRTSIRLAENAGLNRFIFMENNGLFEDEEEYQLSLKALHGIIANEEKFYANIGSIYLYLPRTDVIVTGDTMMPLAQFPDRDFVAGVSAGAQEKAWSGVRTTKAKLVSGYPSSEDVVTLHRHLTNDGLVNDATLFIDVKMSLFKQTENFRSASPLALIVTSADNRLIFADANGLEGAELLAGKQMDGTLDDGKYIRSTAHSNYNDWNYTVVLPKRWLFAPLQDVNRMTIAVALAVLLLGLLVSFYFSRRFHRPLEAALAKWRGYAAAASGDAGAKSRNDSHSLQESLHSLVDSTLSYADVLDANRATIKNAMLLDLLKNNEWPQPDALIGLSLPRGGSFYQVITCVRDENAELTERDKGLIQYAVHNRVKETFEESGSSYGFELASIDDNSFGILLFGMPGEGAAPTEEDVSALLCRIQERFRPFPQFAWTFGVGNRYESEEFVSQSFRESQMAVHYRIYRGKGSLIRFRELQAGDSRLSPSSDEWMKYKDKTLSGIRSRDPESTRRAVFELCEWMERSPGSRNDRMRLNGIYYIGFSVFTEIEKLIFDLNMDRASIYPNDRSFVKLIESDPTVVDIRQLLLETCERMIGYLDAKPPAGKSSFVASIVEYIRLEYREQQISLESTADRFGMNPSYLGQLLKKELNRTFLQLLSEVRIERAKQLLSDPAVQIQDVASCVGYGNRSTFIRMFKSHAGITPSEFRNRMLLEKRGGSIRDQEVN